MAGQIYIQGTTVRLEANNVTDVTGTPITTPTSITLYIQKSNGQITTITTGIVNAGSGNYYYDLTIASNDPVGGWIYQWTITSGSYEDNQQDTFTVQSALL